MIEDINYSLSNNTIGDDNNMKQELEAKKKALIKDLQTSGLEKQCDIYKIIDSIKKAKTMGDIFRIDHEIQYQLSSYRKITNDCY